MQLDIGTFNENDFFSFLKNIDSAKPYTFKVKVGGEDTLKKFAKTYEYYKKELIVVVQDITILKFPDLSTMNLERNISPCGIFFGNSKTFIYEDKYKDNALFANLESLQTFSRNELSSKIKEEADKELSKRQKAIEALYPLKSEDIERRKVNLRSNIYRKIIRGEEISSQLLFDQKKFKMATSYEMYYSYLSNPKKYIKEFVNDYIENSPILLKSHLSIIKAQRELEKSLNKEPRIDRSKKAFKILNNELKDVKQVTIITIEDDTKLVPNDIEIYSNKVKIGSLFNNVAVDQVKAIEYKNKKYLL